jgi:hypothetical protein
MPATYEALSQGGHEAMTTEIFTKIKDYVDNHGVGTVRYLHPSATRPTSADQQGDYAGGIKTFLATSSMTTNKPPLDGNIIHLSWDNNGGWDSQLFVAHGDTPCIYLRGQNAGTWGSWLKVPKEIDINRLYSAGNNTQGTDSNVFALGYFNVRWYSATGKVPGQPNQYGFMATFATGTGSNENHNIWISQSNGDIFHRGTNGSDHAKPPAFKRIADSSNCSSGDSNGQIKIAGTNVTVKGINSMAYQATGSYYTQSQINTKIPSNYRIRAGSVVKVVNAPAGANFTVFTQAQLNSYTGLTNRGPGNTVVWITNGDIGAAAANMTRQGFYGNDYTCTFSVAYGNQNFRFNYIIIAW